MDFLDAAFQEALVVHNTGSCVRVFWLLILCHSIPYVCSQWQFSYIPLLTILFGLLRKMIVFQALFVFLTHIFDRKRPEACYLIIFCFDRA